MTIQEAIRSNKPFRRKSVINTNGIWLVLTENGKLISLDDGETHGIEKRHILADDWEIME